MNKHLNDLEAHELCEKMVRGGHHHANFGYKPHAELFHKKLVEHNISAVIEEKLGHTHTVDTHPSVRLTKHFSVHPSGAAHKALGHFI